MAAEIERKFLLEELPAELDQRESVAIEQGYLAVAGAVEVRLRRAGEARTLTVKRGAGERREETEIELGEEQFAPLWEACANRLAKRRHRVPLGDGLTAEVDVYAGALSGLAVAEVEFPDDATARGFRPPPWFGRELTGDRRFANQSLAIGGMPSGVASDRDRSYGLKRDEEPAAGLERAAAGRAESALARLRAVESGEADTAKAIHGARKDMKKLRTVLRLVRRQLPKKTYAEQNRLFRDAARALSATRDAEVKLGTLEELDARIDGLPGEAVASWRLILETDREAAAGAAREEPAMGEAMARIEAGLEGVEAWPLAGDSWKLVGDGLRRAYRRGRKAMRAAEADPSEARFHEWRKRAKDLWYGLRLVEGAWPRTLEATAEEAHDLSDLLGDHHDLAVLRADLHQRRLGAEETAALEAAIELRQAELAEAAFELGRRLYAERPREFTRRLHRYWEAWRR